VNVTGPSGSAVVSLSNGATTDAIATAFNSVTYLTGVAATKVNGTTVNFNTTNYGSAAKFSIAATSGTFNTTTSGTVAGTDAHATINGQAVTGSGSVFTVTTNQTTLQIAVNPAVSGALQSFTVSGNGLQFVLGENSANSVRYGLPALNTAALGGISGTLTSVSSSGTNSLIGGNSTAALNIINNALNQAIIAQASLGGFQKYTLSAASSVATNTQLNVTSALNAVQGIDAATVSSQLANEQLLQQTTSTALQLFNTQQQNLVSILLGLTSKT
jgi:flagellin-like hook-associated protein FlgL